MAGVQQARFMPSSAIRGQSKTLHQGPRPSPRNWTAWLLVALGLGLAIYSVFRGALDLFFAQEDFRGLAVAKGLLPRHASLWRYLSVQAFMDVFYPLFGDAPKPYHAVGFLLHIANATFLFALLAKRLATAPAVIAAGFFATHPALFTAMYWLSARSDILATTFAMCALAASLRQDKIRWWAVPCFALSLLSKESVILLPVGIWLVRRWAADGKTTEPLRGDWLVPVLCLMSAVFGGYLLIGGAGIGVGAGRESAYALDFTGSLVRNLLTYVGWVVDVAKRPSPLRYLDLQNPDVFVFGALGLMAWGFGCFVRGLRSRGWMVAGAVCLLLLAPVLPLRNHTYHYFLYAPLVAVAWCLGAALDLALGTLGKQEQPLKSKPAKDSRIGRPTSSLVAWVLTGLCLIVLTWNGARLVRRMETRPMRVYPALRGDPIVSRAMVAQNVIKGLEKANLPAGVDLVFVLRERLASLGRIALGSAEPHPPPEDIYPEINIKNALYDGHGVRALVPTVRSVAFVRDSIPLSDATRIVIYAPEGEVIVCTPAQLDTLLRSTWITTW
jgi:hypothetical protein